MKMKIISLFVLVFITLNAAWVWASTPLVKWQYYKDVPVAKEGFTLIQLDPQIMKHCQASFADIRITDQQGQEISSQVIQPGQEEVASEASLINTMEYPDYTSTVIDLGTNPKSHNHIELFIKVDEDYLREVTLEASVDSVQWGKLGTGKIFSYAGEQANKIAYPTTNMRYLRVNISKKSGENAIPVISAQVTFLPTNIYSGRMLTAQVISQRSDKERTKIILDLGVPNYFITSIQIPTSDRNFNRHVDCSTTNDYDRNDEQNFLESERILDYHWNNYRSVKDSIEINQFAGRYLVISIFNGNSPVLNLNKCKVYGCAPALIADLSGPVRLWYGNPQAANPDYDLKEFVSLISSRELPIISAGAQQINPDYQAPVIPWTEKNKWLLDAVIVLVAAGFTVFILRKFKQLKSEEEKAE